jgi:hypothetical protein
MKRDPKTEKKPMAIRLATEADGEALNNLYNEVFKENRPLAHWYWKFPEGLASDWAVINTLAEVDGRIIGNYPSQIRQMLFEGQPARFAYVLDNIVAEEFRHGYPAQKEMFTCAVNSCVETDIAVGYGFPNERAYKVGKRLLGYHDVAVLPELFYRLSWRPAIAKRLPWLPAGIVKLADHLSRRRGGHHQPAGTGEPVLVDFVERFPEETDQLWARLKSRRAICAERTRAFLNWRFGRDDIIRYWRLIARDPAGVMVGYLVCRIMPVNGDRIGYLVDFLFESEQVLAQLLNHAFALLDRERADYVSVMIAPGTPEEAALNRLGFENKAGFGGRPFVALDLTGTLPFATVLNPANWYLSYADTDLI